MKHLLLFIFTLSILSCTGELEKKPSGPKGFKPNPPTKSKKDDVKSKNNSKRFGGKPSQVDEDLYKKVLAEKDSIMQILNERQTDYVRKKNNYDCKFPNLTKVILTKMKDSELERQKIPAKYLTQEFYDMYSIEYTDARILKYIDKSISDYITYTSNTIKLNFSKVDSTDFITQ